MKFDLSIKSVFDDIKLACIYLLKEKKVKPKLLIDFFELSENTIYDWSEKVKKNIYVNGRQNLYSNIFLENNKDKIKKTEKSDINKIKEMIWTLQNFHYPIVVIARYYKINEKYLFNLSKFTGSCKKYKDLIIDKPDDDKVILIDNKLQHLNLAYNNNQKERKKVAAWLLTNSNLTENEISLYTFLSYSAVHRLNLIYNKDELRRYCIGINNVNLHTNENNDYYYSL